MRTNHKSPNFILAKLQISEPLGPHPEPKQVLTLSLPKANPYTQIYCDIRVILNSFQDLCGEQVANVISLSETNIPFIDIAH